MEAAPVQKGALTTARKISVAVSDDGDDVKSGSRAVGEGRILQADADIEAGFKAASGKPKEAAADPEEQKNKDVNKTRDFGLVGKGGQFDESCNFMQGMQKENADVHAV